MNDNLQSHVIRRQMARQIGEIEVVLETAGFEARAPSGGFVWNRPAAVVVGSAAAGGPAAGTRLPISDLTRRWQAILYGIALLFALAGLAARGRAPRETTS